jgi:hypothetical protein
MNLIDISDKEYKLFNRYIGQGKVTSPLVFFGNEPGMSGLGYDETVNFLKYQPAYKLGGGFMLKESYSKPTTSEFARFSTRLCLGLKYNDERWFHNLSNLGKITLNECICTSQLDKDHSLINLRPLPRPTEDTWIYSGIDKKEYYRLWNFGLKRHYSDPEKELRLGILKTFFEKRTGLVIGVGDKRNKKIFLESLDLGYDFHEADLDHHTIFFDIKNKIILSDYFNNRNGIKIIGLQDLYRFISSRRLINF